MPAAVETAAFANEGAWHRLGNVIDTNGEKGMTIPQALPATGLDWGVTKLPEYSPSEFVEENGVLVPKPGCAWVRNEGRYDIRRDSDGKYLGNVGEIYNPTQNAEGFAIVDDFIKVAGGEGCPTWIESGGSLDGGRKVWLLVHLEDDMFIAGEKIATYLLFSNAHDGRGSLLVALVSVRVVCQNTLTWALQSAPRVMRVRHTINSTKRIKQAIEIFGMRDRRNEELAKQGEWLVENEMKDEDFDRFLASLMPVKDGAEGTPAETMIKGRRSELAALYNGAENLDPIRGTRWGAMQAVVEYADYARAFKSDESQLKAQFGMNEQALVIKDRAAAILLDPRMEALPA